MEFNHQWYNNLIAHSDEKQLIIDAVRKFASINGAETCLEIGMGTGKQFSDSLAGLFRSYTIVEKEDRPIPLQPNTTFIRSDWEETNLIQRFDIIIASHVWYYFKDKKRAVWKMLQALSKKGVLIIVLNGPESDYGNIKQFFGTLIGQPYRFAYREFYETPEISSHCLEFTIPSTVKFHDYEGLYTSLQLGFDQYPEDYLRFKPQILDYLEKNIRHNRFTIHQKLIVMQQNPAKWDYLLRHPDYWIEIGDEPLLVKDGVFTPDPMITFSTSWLLQHLPPVAGREILDIGCGTGIIALLCAERQASRVIAADINETAVINTLLNAQSKGLTEKLTVLQSDLFERIDDQFDYIFGNLPILDEVWQDTTSSAVDLLHKFLAAAPTFLRPGGRIYFSWASFAALPPVISILDEFNYTYEFKTAIKDHTEWYLFIVAP